MIVFTAGIMDLCHRGHLNLLRTMRERAGDGKVIVVLHTDEACYRIKGKIPVQDISKRLANLKITGLVDQSMITNQVDPADAFRRIFEKHPAEDCLFLRGDDNLDPPGRWLLDELAVKQEYIPYTPGVSSTSLRDDLLGA